jgi:hypothetical protein
LGIGKEFVHKDQIPEQKDKPNNEGVGIFLFLDKAKHKKISQSKLLILVVKPTSYEDVS